MRTSKRSKNTILSTERLLCSYLGVYRSHPPLDPYKNIFNWIIISHAYNLFFHLNYFEQKKIMNIFDNTLVSETQHLSKLKSFRVWYSNIIIYDGDHPTVRKSDCCQLLL